jgi:hypothetical protein
MVCAIDLASVPAPSAAHTEWWYASVVDPATKRALIIVISSAPVSATATFWYDTAGNKSHRVSLTTPVHVDPGPQVSSSAGNLTYDPARHAYHLVYHANGYLADIWFANALPGITTGPMAYDGQSMS